MNVEQARFKMVERQIRTWEGLDQTILDTLFKVKREEYIPEKYRPLEVMSGISRSSTLAMVSPSQAGPPWCRQ
jgi:protein-L-isoaspartate O-methyltransferase